MKNKWILGALISLVLLTAVGCKDEIVKWMQRQGMEAVSVPASTWEPGTLVIWTSGQDSRVDVQRVCARARILESAPNCVPSTSFSVSDAANFNATISAAATKMFQANANFSHVKNVKANMNNVMLCEVSIDQLNREKLKKECSDPTRNAIAFAVRTKDKSRTFVTWINQAIRADVDFEVESDADFGAGADVQIAQIVGVNNATDIATGTQALLPDAKVEVKWTGC